MTAPEASQHDAGFGYAVHLLIPLLAHGSSDELVSALHRADRRLGVISGREGKHARLILLTQAAGEEDARSQARSSIAGALESTGLPQRFASDMEIRQVVRHKLGPGRPRSLRAPALPDYRTLTLPDGRTLRATRAGPTGDWVVYLESAEEQAWAGRGLLSVLSELLDLPHGKKDDWVYELIRRLAGRETPLGTRYACPCCDCWTLDEPPPGTFATCPVCRWEDDGVQFRDLDFGGGANRPSLREARENFRRFGASNARSNDRVRSPRPEEQPF